MLSTITIATLLSAVQSFTPQPTSLKPTFTTSSTKLHVFDFFKKRAEEGVDQLKNLSEKTAKGKLIEGLTDAASYSTIRTDG